MYTAEEREQIIDIVDKMSLLRQDFDGAFTWIKENVSMPFDFDGEQQFISDLKQDVYKRQALINEMLPLDLNVMIGSSI